jgi:hypothetical protein
LKEQHIADSLYDSEDHQEPRGVMADRLKAVTTIRPVR